jgi:hypothetical protein
MRRSSGLERVPPIFRRPWLSDPFFWIFLATAAFWVLLLAWFLA